ncbi:hypothetical protein [Tissierella sp. Yu-01]|uniref:WD40/YVTN/BNR-like repeat-containing protein n=1 Tax=Tissierella sp. Yu-01 TaxID=3035694 RepID=UPI00240E1A46|nr:hypothetical protein [Tissierella sp. Yu-01]WFA09044.1 hypothetical protein P3962_00310 [Tissierella sp. Yu-01]
MSNNKSKRPNKYWIIFCFSLVLTGSIYFAYYKYQQSKIVIKEPEGFSIESKSENITLVGVKWLETYNKQFYQKYIPNAVKLVDYSIEDIFILEDDVIQVDFLVETKVLDEETTLMWDGYIEDNIVKCQWVLWFDRENGGENTNFYTVSKVQRPAAYDLEKYQTSEEKQKDEYEQEYVNEIPFEEKKYTYKIENEKCYVSYDLGITWSLVPVELETLVEVGDGNSYYNKLQEGSFIITPEKTVFVYGGTRKSNLLITYSDDMGVNWNTAKVNENISSNRIKFCSFPTEQVGYIIATSDRTMSQEAQMIFKTTDGGETWSEMGNGPSTWLLSYGGFVDENTGFMSYPKIEGAETNFYRTIDGGKSFEPIILPVHQEEWLGLTLEPFIQPETPYMENGDLYLLINQGPQGDFKGGTIKAKYKSNDMGETWIFDELVDIPIRTIG